MIKKVDIKTLIPFSKKSRPAPDQAEKKWIDRGWYFVLEFELISSARFEAALDIAKKNPYFAELVDERGITLFRTIYFKKDFPKFSELFGLVGAWKNTRLIYKGDEIAKEDFEVWFSSYQQYWGHRKTLNDNDFCGMSKLSDGPDFLGCYDRNVSLRWRDPLMMHYPYGSKVWYSFGKRVKNTYVVDRRSMADHLNKINEEYVHCPCYGHELIELYLNKLPAEINPAIHTEWLFKEEYLKSSAGRVFFNYDIAMSMMPDVCPVNKKAYEKFMSRIFKAGN